MVVWLLGCVWLAGCGAPPRPTMETAVPAPTATPEWLVDVQEARQRQAQPAADFDERLHHWNSGASLGWQELARQLVAKNSVNPPRAARLFALLSLAQQEALTQLYADPAPERWLRPHDLDPAIQVLWDTGDNLPVEAGAMAGASAEVLHQFFAQDDGEILGTLSDHMTTVVGAGAALRSDLNEAQQVGRQAAQKILAAAQDDGSAHADDPVVLPTGVGLWRPNPQGPPSVTPNWGKVRPMLLASADQFRAAPPPAFDSPQYKAALAEVRQVSDTRTDEQLRIARAWADSPGTMTPPGHWNEIAAEAIRRYHLTERQTAHVLSVLNMAMSDAGIAIWDSKFHYLMIRPWQVDGQIILPVGKPNHPSYPSGHSGFSGAAAAVLNYFFPGDHAQFEQALDDASLSRLYGGIHYRFDLDAGVKLGQAVGEVAVQYARDHGWLPFTQP